MTTKEDKKPKIESFGIAKAFVVLTDDGKADIKALNPSDEQIVELTKHWHDEKLKQD